MKDMSGISSVGIAQEIDVKWFGNDPERDKL